MRRSHERGAVARRLIGTVTITGMIFSSGFAIFLIPVLFVVVERLSHRLSGKKQEPASTSVGPRPADDSVSNGERAAGGG